MLKTSQFKTVCTDDSGFITQLKQQKSKKVILLVSTLLIGRFWCFFAPQRRHVARIGLKFDTDEGFPSCQISPRRWNDKGTGPPNWIFYWNFYCNLTKMWNTNASKERIACASCTKFAEFVSHFRMRYIFKFHCTTWCQLQPYVFTSWSQCAVLQWKIW